MSHIEVLNELTRLLNEGECGKILDIVTRIEQILNLLSSSHESSNLSRDLRNVSINLLDRVFGETTTGYEASTRSVLIPRSNEAKNAGTWNSNKDGWLYELNGKIDVSEFSSIKTPRKTLNEKNATNAAMKLVQLLSANHINYTPGSTSSTPGSRGLSTGGTPVTPASLGGYAASVQYTPFMQHFRQSFNNADLFQLKISLLPRKARFTHKYRSSQAWGEVKKVLYWHKDNEIFFEKLLDRAQKVKQGIISSQSLVTSWKREHGAEEEMHISLHPFDYFMICLLRHPLNEPAFIPKNSNNYDHFNVITTLQSSGDRGWYPGNPYLELLDGYIQEFIPLTSSKFNNWTPGGSNVKTKQYTDGTSELYIVNKGFLKLVSEFWIDQASIIKSNYHDIDLYKELFNATTDAAERNTIPEKINRLQRFDKLKEPDKGKVLSSYYSPDPDKLPLLIPGDINRWNVPVLQCIYIVLRRVLTALNLDDDYDASIFKVFDNSRASVTSSAMKRDAGESLGNSLFTLEILSPALFDMLRCIFSNANKHSCALFTLSVEIWLLYLQPWTTGRKGESLDLNKWKLYIANNIHFYTTLFVCYIRGVSTVTFYTSDRSGSFYFEYFQRVVNLFSSDLLREVNELVNNYDHASKDKDVHQFAMHRHHSTLYPDNLDEERGHPMARRRWLQDRFIKIIEYAPLKGYLETIYKISRDNSNPNPSSNKYVNAATKFIDSVYYKMFNSYIFQQRLGRQEIHNAFSTRATKGPSLSELESVLDIFRQKIHIQPSGWDFRNLANIVDIQAQAQGNQAGDAADYGEYTKGKKKPTRESIIKKRTPRQDNDDEVKPDEWEIVVDFLKSSGLSAVTEVDLRYLVGNKWNSTIVVAALLVLCSAFISPLLFDLIDLLLLGRFVVYYICPSFLGIHLVTYSRNLSGISYNITSVNDYDRHYQEIITANVFLIICIQMDLMQLKELLTVVLCFSLFILYAVDTLLTARLVTLYTVPPKYLIRLYCVPALLMTRFCFRFETLSLAGLLSLFNQFQFKHVLLYIAALYGVFSAARMVLLKTVQKND